MEILHVFGLDVPWFLKTKNCYIIPNIGTISLYNSYSCISQRGSKFPKDKIFVLNLFLSLIHIYSAVPCIYKVHWSWYSEDDNKIIKLNGLIKPNLKLHTCTYYHIDILSEDSIKFGKFSSGLNPMR